MPFETVAPFRLYQQVAGQIEALIKAGDLAAGTRLPAERDLAARLGVSRPTLREAMVALEIAGLVEVRTGSGIYVTAAARQTSGLKQLQDAGAGPLELIEARSVIEAAIARDAARLERQVFTAARATIADMTAAADTETHRDADRRFHMAIAGAGGNSVMVSVVEAMWRQMFSPIFERMGRLTGLFPESRFSTVDDHEAILEALEAGDADAAEAAMRRHLENVRETLLDSGMTHMKDGGSDALA